jgi:hypothetical protein
MAPVLLMNLLITEKLGFGIVNCQNFVALAVPVHSHYTML